MIFARTPLGYKAIVNNSYEGMIFASDAIGSLKRGDVIQGYIKNIRPDGKIDLTLQPIGGKKENAVEKILELLSIHGSMNFTYKSDADEIAKVFGVSKKAFKAGLSKLIEEKKIILEERLIRKL